MDVSYECSPNLCPCQRPIGSTISVSFALFHQMPLDGRKGALIASVNMTLLQL